jgi:hypothetical protein
MIVTSSPLMDVGVNANFSGNKNAAGGTKAAANDDSGVVIMEEY